MKKRILGILLSICMVLSIMPTQVFAVGSAESVMSTGTDIEPSTVTTEDELTTALATGGNIQLGADITATDSYNILRDITVVLDLNGFTLDFGEHRLGNSGTFEICDSGSGGSIVGNSDRVIHNGSGSLTLTGGTVSNNSTEYGMSYTIYNRSNGEVVINGGTVIGASLGYGIYNYDGSVTINGGIVSTVDGKNLAIWNEDSLTVTGGEIQGAWGIEHYSGAFEMTGGTIFCKYGIILNSGTATISGGKISDMNLDSYIGGAGITIFDGDLTISGDAEIEMLTDYSQGVDIASGKCTLTGGTITATGANAMGIRNDDTLVLSGGAVIGGITSSTSTLADCLAVGYLYYNENGEVITLEEGQTELTGTFTVAECTNHSGGTATCTTLAVCDICKGEYGTYYHADENADNYCDVCGLLVIEYAFPDANFRTYITENIDTDQDGLLSSEEITAVTSINVHGKGISDLSGIKYFTELTELDLTNNNLTSIDISALSELTILSVYNNTKLASLNLSGNPALEQLNISFCTSLRSLNLSNNINLMSLEAAGCVLTSLDLSHSGAGLIYGSHSSTYIEHCGVGYVNMNLLGDVTRMEITSGGTMGSDGWLLLDPNAADDYGYIWIRYNYDTGNEYDELPVEIRVIHDDFSHTYVANTTSKDATHHYTQWCETCRTGNEEAVVAHTIKYNYTTKYTDSQHKEYCTVCGYYVIETCTYSSECDEVCSECNLTTRLFPDWSVHSFVYTTYEDGDDDSSNDSHSATCEDCGAYIGEFCTYEFACSETCVCGRANPDAAAHTVQYVARGNGTHDKFCGVCKISFELDAPCVYGENTEDSYYFVSPATCISGATWYKSCACGQKSTETFVAGDTDPGNHTGTNDKLVPNGVLHHNVVWSCCDAVVTENVDCTATNADGSCSTAETCVCGNLLIGAKDNHKLTYTASGNVITETCGWTGCEHTATATLHAPENPVYDGTQKLASVTHSEDWAGYRIDAISYSGTANDGSSYAGILYPAVKAGTVTASINAQSEDYTVATASVEYTIEKATNEWTQAPAITGWTYGEFGNEPTATPKFGSVGLSSFSYRVKGTVAWTNNPPSDAGIYEMRTRVQASDNWELLETTIEFEIKKAIPTVDTFDFTPPANLVCDGLAKEATVTVKEAIEGVGSVTVKYFKDGVELTGAPTAVGTYTVQIDVAEGANFKPATLTDETWTFTVVEHDPGCHMDANKDMICDGCGMEASVMFDPYKVLIMKGYSSPDWFFVSLYLDSETTEEACENGSEYAIYPDTKTVYAVVTNGDQTETKTVAIDIVYQVEITWTETEFTYVDGEWNPETHEQTGGWEGSCEITLTNTGTMPVDYELTYTSVVEGITGVFSTTENPTAALASGSLDIGDVKTVAFKPEGRPPRDLNDEKIGTLTVKLGGD